MSATTVQLIGIGLTFAVALASLLLQIASRPRSKVKVRANWWWADLRDSRGYVLFGDDELEVVVANEGDFDEVVMKAVLVDEAWGEYPLESLVGKLEKRTGRRWAEEAGRLDENTEGFGRFKSVLVRLGTDKDISCRIEDTRGPRAATRFRRWIGRAGNGALRKLRLRKPVPTIEI